MRCPLLPLLDALAWLLARAPQSLLLGLGRALAGVGRPWLRSRRRIARRNIDLCFPGLDAAERGRLADASVENAMVGVVELFRAWHAPAATLRPLATVTGIEHLQAALARGRGVVVLGGHTTHIEMGIRLVGEALGRPLHVMLRRHNDAGLERWIDRSRRRVYAGTIGKKEVPALLQALRDGHPVIYAADQDFNRRHAFVPFFGVPAATLTALPGLLRDSGAAMVTFWTRRDDDGHYHVRVGPAWTGWPTGDDSADAARYMAELEALVREAPAQYLWVHKRFKTRPQGEPKLYEATRKRRRHKAKPAGQG